MGSFIYEMDHLGRIHLWHQTSANWWELFLDASSHLYNRACPSDGPSVGRSVRPSVGDAFVKNKGNHCFPANNCRRRYTRQISCNHIIIQSFNHHEDASLALWALFCLEILKFLDFDKSVTDGWTNGPSYREARMHLTRPAHKANDASS